MYLVFESEVFQSRQYLTERIGKLDHRGYLPVEVPAVDIYMEKLISPLVRIEICMNMVRVELEMGTVEPEDLCCVHKLYETWNGKRELFK
jgi:hypothetical protein